MNLPTVNQWQNRARLSNGLPAIAAACIVSLAGCTNIDQWEIFEHRIENELQAQRTERFEVPAGVRPIAESPADLPSLEGDGPLELTIEQAVMLAMTNNRELAVEQLNPVIAGTFEQIERGRFDPQIFGSVEYGENEANETDRGTGGSFSVARKESFGEAGVRQELPTGTDIELSASTNRDISNRAPEQQELRFGMTVTQALLRGFGPATNLASVRQAELETLASTFILQAFAETLLAETETAYWNYVLASEEISIFQRSLEVAEQQLSVIRNRIEVGALARTESAAAQAEIARRRQALIEAGSELEATRLRLLRLMNPSIDASIERPLTIATDYAIEPTPIEDIHDRIRLAQRVRPEIGEAEMRLEQNRLETLVTRNGLLPRLDVFLVLGRSGYDNTFARSFRNLNDGTYDFTAGVRFSHYLNNRAAKARDLAARVSRRQAAEAVNNLKQIVRLDVQLAANEVERTRKQIAAAAVTRQFAEQTVEAEEGRFAVGNSTSLLVAQAQRDLLAAEIGEVEAIISYRIAIVNLYLAEGTLLSRRGVTIGATDRR